MLQQEVRYQFLRLEREILFLYLIIEVELGRRLDSEVDILDAACEEV